jgi:hypothetical protein
MKKFSLMLVAAMLLSAGSLFANDGKIEKKSPTKGICVKIGKLLQDNNFDVEQDLKAMVKVTVNKDREIVVLSVDTENDVLESFIKGRLNYQKVEQKYFKEGRVFNVPVRITAES